LQPAEPGVIDFREATVKTFRVCSCRLPPRLILISLIQLSLILLSLLILLLSLILLSVVASS